MIGWRRGWMNLKNRLNKKIKTHIQNKHENTDRRIERVL